MTLRRLGFQAKRTLLRQLIEAGIEASSCLGDKQPTQSLQRVRLILAGAQLFLEMANLRVHASLARVRRQYDREWIERQCGLIDLRTHRVSAITIAACGR